jgi:hypothetical protein
MNVGIVGRIFAGCIAAVASIGLIVQLAETYSATSSLALTLWIILAFFTITSNILVAVVFTCIAINRGVLRSEGIVAGTMLYIILVGVVNALLLWGALELSGGSALVDKLLHVATPVLVPVFWVFFQRKGGLNGRHPLLWAIYPVLYLAYVIARGAASGKYPYPFLNVATFGWQRIALNSSLIALGFLAAGYLVVWIDHLLGNRTNPHSLKQPQS